MPYLDIFAIEFSKTIVLFEIATMKFEKFENLANKSNIPKFASQNDFFWYLWARISKSWCPKFFI